MESKLLCYILEDEVAAVNILKKHIEKLSDIVDLVGYTSDFLVAKSILDSIKIDILFLDIRLPKTTGFKFLDLLQRKPQIILTTAHTDYASESYEYNAVDYLMKPISFEKFEKAVFKAIGKQDINSNTIQKSLLPKNKKYVLIKNSENNRILKVNFKEIIYLESKNKSTIFKTINQDIQSSYVLGQWERNLPENDFLRIHKSYIINVNFIESIEKGKGNIKLANIDKPFPIGDQYKIKFQNHIDNNSVQL
ncbi:LytTR family DNA-binding domain-containing protein [Chitinophaga sp. LS1]|uniref:LytR/AlgR family response regulator transcription factor n=1 Tax=Chitinophaga sp. LS1 TaxID=3051176 RepID=UPI002AAC13DE|nr:LytTR family DNA-binding domain-containing protein [Chitinophaga sp. LS1]WPV67539.1 LytTR family DNA-binding domain-containing protein [Chitinophaga sp. LS1]